MRLNDCQLGDAYQDKKREDVIKYLKEQGEYWIPERDPPPEGPYLSYVKRLVPKWPQLELLADFMEVGTVPTRWCHFPEEDYGPRMPWRDVYPAQMEERRKHQNECCKKMNVALLEYKEEEEPTVTRFQNYKPPGSQITAKIALEEAVKRVKENKDKDKLSLFIVEDLSKDIIETLGAGFAIDPRFFRAHIADYVWNNIRDRWREQPSLKIMEKRRDWFQMRVVHSRYFENGEDLAKAKKEVDKFNIFRRMDADKNQIFWDKDPGVTIRDRVKGHAIKREERVDAKVGHVRSRATFWLQNNGKDEPAVGVLLLEPTPKAGFPLWRGYASWDNIPKFGSGTLDQPDVPPSMRPRDGNEQTPPTWFEDIIFWSQKMDLSQSLLSSTPHPPLAIPIQALLHLVCAEWITFADYLNARLNQIDWGITKPSFFPDNDDREQSLKKLHFWRRWVPQARDMLTASMRQTFDFDYPESVQPLVSLYKEDYEIIRERLNEYETRIDRLTTVVNSAISLGDARNTSNLTVIAIFFIPPSLIAAILSMNTEPLDDLVNALKWWGTASVSSVALLLMFYYLVIREVIKRFTDKFKLPAFGFNPRRHLRNAKRYLKTHFPRGRQGERIELGVNGTV